MNTDLRSIVVGTIATLALFGGTLRADEFQQLTPAEKSAGWKLLFDGQSIQGWRSFKKQTFPEHGWVVEGGWLKCLPGIRGGDIITLEQFTDFELQWEWRIPAKANSGLKYFITEDREKVVGHEYQIWDDIVGGRPKHRTASFYDVLAPQPHQTICLAPESNHSRIVVRGNHVEHWLNGEKVLEYECGSEVLTTAIANSKFKTVPGFGNKIRGHILLTDHRDEAWFRNIKIRPITTAIEQ